MMLLHSDLCVHNLEPVHKYDQRRQYEPVVEVAGSVDDSASVQVKIVFAPFQRLSSKQLRENGPSAGLMTPT